MQERGGRVCHSGRRRQHGPPQQRCTVPREALVDVGSSLPCSALSHGHPDMATVAARRTPSGLDLSRPPAKTHSRRAPEAGATGSASRSLAARARAGPLPPLSETGVPAAASSTSSVEASRPTSLRRPALQQPAPSTPAVASLARGAFALGGRLRCACTPWPCLLEEKGSLLAGQGYLRSSPPARPGCGLILCKAVMPPHPDREKKLSIVETVHAAE